MNREIKFKAKRLDNGEWVYGFFYQENDNTYIIEDCQKDSPLNRNIPYKVDPNTVCQFTGRTDEDGKELYENDIIRYKSIYHNDLYKIAWSEEHLAFRVYNERGQEEGSLADCLRFFDCYLKGSALDKEEKLWTKE